MDHVLHLIRIRNLNLDAHYSNTIVTERYGTRPRPHWYILLNPRKEETYYFDSMCTYILVKMQQIRSSGGAAQNKTIRNTDVLSPRGCCHFHHRYDRGPICAPYALPYAFHLRGTIASRSGCGAHFHTAGRRTYEISSVNLFM
jgi:hypothetical protein